VSCGSTGSASRLDARFTVHGRQTFRYALTHRVAVSPATSLTALTRPRAEKSLSWSFMTEE